MAFSTKLNLDDSKFEQQTGSTLTLGGELKYATAPTFTGDTQLITKKYVDDNIVSGTTSGTTYAGASPAAVTVGGITAGDTLTGKTSNELLEDLLVPTLFPTFTAPSNGFSDDAANTQEVGVTGVTINFTATFDQGSINPQYTAASDKRSGLPNEYNYTGTGLPATQASTSLTDNQQITGYTIVAGANTWTSSVDYDAGVQPKDSVGGDFDSPLGAGTTSSDSVTVTGIYPVFYGTAATKPTAGSALLVGATKDVTTSNGTVTVPFNTSGVEFTWMAIPATSTNKTIWYVSALSNGAIATSSPTAAKYVRTDGVSVNSPTGLWSGVNYDFYISELGGEDTTVEFRNS